jgi:carbamoyl-phosphate synthase small subunit
MTGYQEILTDPSYAGQIITFTFPHVGNVGANTEDLETTTPAARGLILRADVTDPSNWRSERDLDDWLKSFDLVGISGVDTRRLTRRIRDGGAPNGVIAHAPDGLFDMPALLAAARAWPGLEGMDLAKAVSCRQTYSWSETRWALGAGYGRQEAPTHHVVAVDFGAKRNILRCLASTGARVTVVPATATAEEILAHAPDGVFLSNGPGDPAATGAYAVPAIRGILDAGVPLFGICLGHQLLGLSFGGHTRKMPFGHRGGNQPVKDLASGQVLITSQNHGFAVAGGVDGIDGAPDLQVTHINLNDGTVEGLRHRSRPIFGVQYHPEAAPGPHDAVPHFAEFLRAIESHRVAGAQPLDA